MNVQRVLTTVVKFVLTLLVPSPAHVTVATDCPAMEGAVMVCSHFYKSVYSYQTMGSTSHTAIYSKEHAWLGHA